jgi:uncharacterized protein (DUF924 family)
MSDPIDAIHQFWFGPLDDTGMPRDDRRSLWFRKEEAIDRDIRQRFGSLLEQARAGQLDGWAGKEAGRVALVILLDQFSRNIHRDSALAYAGDAKALQLAQEAIASGHFQRLPAIHQVFLFMPLEHSEDLECQEECVTLFEELADVTGQAQIADFTRYAIAHRDVIARFGRFPHRNTLLGRESTAAELEYLNSHGGF